MKKEGKNEEKARFFPKNACKPHICGIYIVGIGE
jgi:hypothetical protein